MNQEDKEKIAIWKFGIISPLLSVHQGGDSKYALARKIAAQEMINPVTGQSKFYSPRTLVWWCNIFENHGIDGLISRNRRDQGQFRALKPEAQTRLCEILDQYPKLSNVRVRERLKNEGWIDDSLSQSTIDRFVRAARPEKKLPDIHLNKDRKAFEFMHANECWQADTTFLPKLHGEKICLMLIVDDASRMVMGYGIFPHDNAANFLKVLKDAIARNGKPARLLLDHGAPYENHHLNLACAQAGIKISYCAVRDGSQKGKIERLNRTLKEGWLSQVDWASFIDLSEIKNSFRHFLYPEYINKPHSSLVQKDGTCLTPRERFLLDQDYIQKISLEKLDSIFVCRYERKVKTNSTVSIQNILYEVPSEYMKEKVEVFIDPLDDNCAWILDSYTKKKVPIQKLNKQQNAYTPRKRHIVYPRKELE